MKRSDIKITVKLGDVMDAPLIDSWQKMCAKYGINEWCLKEELAERNDTVNISLEDAENYGIIKPEA